MAFLAHRLQLSDGTWETQTVSAHLLAVAELAGNFASCFDSRDEAACVGLLHDLGKYSDLFQERLCGRSIRVDHATAGAGVLRKRGDDMGAMAVAGHHGGLPDFGTISDTAEEDTLIGRCKRTLPDYARCWEEITLPAAVPPAFVSSGNGFDQSFYTRMLYSCLVDADFLDTEAFMSQGQIIRGGYDPIETLETRFSAYAEAHWTRQDTQLNSQRLAIRQQCEAMSDRKPGLYSLTVPTGGGKTAASMAFALKHARKYGKKRVIYVIPYTSIIEQNSEVFEAALGEENVIQHHSGVELPEVGTASPEEERRRLAAENWDAPIIMTTAVQFLESLFACKPSRCRKLHNIANSVVIFDEAQMLPVHYLRPCIAAIAQLVTNYKVTAVLCTATQPNLAPLFEKFSLPIAEICPNISKAVFRRVQYRDVRDWDEDTLLHHLQQERQALCIVNTRKKALELYSRLEGDGTYHLSTRMTPHYRKRILSEIRQRLGNGLSCRVVSTSLVEAGVDVDFPAVYREIAGMDSIVQAAGRCNREGKLQDQGTVYLFQLSGKVPDMIQQNVDATLAVLRKGLLPDGENAVRQYFACLYRVKGANGMDRKGIYNQLCQKKLPIRSVARDFKLIEEDTETVYIPTAENGELLDALRSGFADRRTMRRLEQDGVSVYPYQYQSLLRSGCLEEITSGVAILCRQDYYRMDTGLQVEPGQGCAIFA